MTRHFSFDYNRNGVSALKTFFSLSGNGVSDRERRTGAESRGPARVGRKNPIVCKTEGWETLGPGRNGAQT